MKKIKDGSLYLVLTGASCLERDPVKVAMAAISGGVNLIQMREKNMIYSEHYKLGSKLKKMCDEAGIPFIVNDSPHLAKDLDADGVHLGQEDILQYPIEATRKLLGRDKIIGISTHSLDQFEKATAMDVDYLGFGPIYSTTMKSYHIGDKDISIISKTPKKPFFCIGGIDIKKIKKLGRKGARNFSMIRAITQAEDVCGATKAIKEEIDSI